MRAFVSNETSLVEKKHLKCIEMMSVKSSWVPLL